MVSVPEATALDAIYSFLSLSMIPYMQYLVGNCAGLALEYRNNVALYGL